MPHANTSRREAVGAALAATAIPALMLWTFIARTGVPGFFHDWVWSLFADQTRTQWQLLLSAWQHVSLGGPNAVPTINPAAWLKVGLAWVVPAWDSEKLYLLFAAGLASAAIYTTARMRLRTSIFAAACASATFVGGTFYFSKTASGQSSYWIATAAFAWGCSFLLAAFEADDLRAALRAGVCFAIATIQLQFLPFAWIAIALGALCTRRASAWRPAMVMFGASLCIALPSLALLGGLGPARGADVPQPYPLWQYAQSSSWLDALTWMGYAGEYPARAAATWFAAAEQLVRFSTLAIVAIGAAFAVRSLRTFATRWLLALGVVGFVWVAGYYGPLSFAWQWLFTHVADVAFLREFFHAAVLGAYSAALLFALAVDRVLPRARIAFGAGVVLLVACATLPSWSGGYGRILPFLTPPGYLARVRQALPATPSRLLFYPVLQPLSVRGTSGGDDSFDWAGAQHTSLYRFFLPQPVAFVAAQLANGDADGVTAMLARMNAAGIIFRPDITSIAAAPHPAPSADALMRALAPRERVALGDGATLARTQPLGLIGGAARTEAMPADFRDLSDPRATYLDVPGNSATTLRHPLAFRPDPASGWVTTQQVLAFVPGAAASPALGLVTTRRGASLTIAPATSERRLSIWAPQGALVDGTRLVAPRYRDVSLPVGRDVRIVALGPTALGEIGAAPIATPLAPSDATGTFVTPWRATGSVRLRGRGVVVLRTAYDPGWRLRVEGATVRAHVRADGYANAWIVSGDGTHRFVMEYAPQRRVWLLLSVSLLAFITLAALAVRPRIRT
ncbi:MAG: hypothetical protein KGN02_08020 [bacterium]|nr:hypothetical protein [bacterium]